MQLNIVNNISKRKYLMEISQLHHDIGNKITDFQNTKPNHLSHRCNNRENKDYHEDYKKIDDYNKRDT